MDKWDRQYRFKATCENIDGFEVGAPNSKGFAVHISFNVQRSTSSTLNTTKIKLWNLTKAQIEVLMTLGCEVTLTAGYGESRPLIFTGTVSNVTETLDGADQCVEIEAVDGLAAVSSTVVSVSYERNTSCYKVLMDVADKLALPVTFSKSAQSILETAYFADGYSYIGYASDVLDNIMSVSVLQWTIQNGVLQIRKSGEGMDTYVHLVNKSTGLIGIPKRVYNSSVSTSDTGTIQDTLYGYQIDFLMDGSLCVGDRIRLESNMVTGIFYIADLSINGDNVSGSWSCTAKVTETDTSEDES